MKTYQTRHISEIFSISTATVRKYADIYKEFMSTGVDVADGKHRNFSPDDLIVFATVVALRAESKDFEEINAFLEQGQRLEPPTINDESLQIVTSSAGNVIMQKFGALEERLQALEDRDESHLKEDNERLRKEIRELYKQIGRLEGKLENDSD